MSGERDEWTELAELAESGLLAASLFHEIRQPLFVLKGLVDLAIEGRAPLGEAELLVLRQELHHVEALVEHYGALQPRAGPPSTFDLVGAVRVAIETLGPRARQAGVTVRTSFGPPVDVVARPVAVRQVVLNVVSNAIDAAADHGRTVEVTVRRHGDPHSGVAWAEIEVVDSGPGIDPAVRDRLGKPFVTTKPPGKGTGLGLFVTQRLVEEWGGSLELGSASPGARVTVRLPLA